MFSEQVMHITKTKSQGNIRLLVLTVIGDNTLEMQNEIISASESSSDNMFLKVPAKPIHFIIGTKMNKIRIN